MGPKTIATTKAAIASEEKRSIDIKRAAAASLESEKDDDVEPQEVVDVILKCPRCDSMDTKFCYYNNYSLTQPRHFCKTCRRYWTKGGALRNVPIGGGCRKNKKLKSSSSNSSIDNSSTLAPPDLGGLKLFHGLSSSHVTDFQLSGLSLPVLNLNSSPSSGLAYNQLSNSFGDIGCSSVSTPTCFSLDNPSLGFNFSFPPLFNQQSGNNGSFGGVGNQEPGYVGTNQEFPWKFQNPTFVDLLSANDKNINQSKSNVSQASYLPSLENHHQIQRPQQILFQNLEMSPSTNERFYGNDSRKERPIDNLETEYIYEDTFSPIMNLTTSRTTSIGAKNENENGSSNWSNGVQAWSNLDQFGELP